MKEERFLAKSSVVAVVLKQPSSQPHNSTDLLGNSTAGFESFSYPSPLIILRLVTISFTTLFSPSLTLYVLSYTHFPNSFKPCSCVPLRSIY